MKYISRITALLLALMMLTPTFASAITVGTATQSDLDKLYQAASSDETVYINAGLLGDWSELSAFGTLADKELYTFQWYDQSGMVLACYEEPTVVRVANTVEEQEFYCVATDATGNQLTSPTFVLSAADISDVEAYLDLLYDYRFLDALSVVDTLSIYGLMTDTWDITLADGSNLAESILNLWWSERDYEGFDPYLLCSCVITGAVESDDCVLHPNSNLHADGCCWKQEEITSNVDVSTPESLLKVSVVILAAAEHENVDNYGWENYVVDIANAGMRWEVVDYVLDTNLYTVPITKESIQTAYRVVVTTENNVFESKPFYLGGYDFYNWIQTTDGIQAWMADGSVTLADVVAKYNAVSDEEDRVNAEDYTYGEEGESVNLKVPQGTFAEDYVMEIEPVVAERVTELQKTVMALMDATGTHAAQMLMALDISFASLADRANKLQPDAPVALTFEVDTTGIDEALKYLYVFHIADNGTPEVVAGPIEAAFGVQTIEVKAEAFSVYAVMLSSDSCAYCSDYCVYEELIFMAPGEQYSTLVALAEEEFEDYITSHQAHVTAGDPAVLCTCKDLLTELTEPGVSHFAGDENNSPCPWHTYYNVHTDVVGWQVTLMGPDNATSYSWSDDEGNELGTETSLLSVPVKSKPHTYYCEVTIDEEPVTYTFYVEAQTTALYSYLNTLYSYYFEYEEINDYTAFVYDLLMSKDASDELHWNFEVYDAEGNHLYNLAEAVLSYWYQTDGADLLCSCIVSGKVQAVDGEIMLAWDAEHDESCPWHISGNAYLELEPAQINDDGQVISYELAMYTELGSKVILATSTLMSKDDSPNEYHYFQDADTGWYVAYLHEEINEDGTVTQWIIPLPSKEDGETN